jgi:hypothetical protein
MDRGQLQGDDLMTVVEDEVQFEAKEPAHLAALGQIGRPGCGPRGAGPPGPNRDASHCGTNAWQKSSTSQKTSTIRSNIIASITEPLTSKILSVTIP